MQHKNKIGPLEAAGLVVAGMALAGVLLGGLDPVALVIVLILAYFAYMARGAIRQAGRFRPVEPPGTWRVTLLANLALMALGIGAFGWYLAGAGALAWVPFLVFIAGMTALRMWRRDVTARLYAWRTPALRLLQKGEYKKLVRELEADATANGGHPDKLAMVALAYVEMNRWRQAEALLEQARTRAPHFASVNGALGMLRRHQARYAEACDAIQAALDFEENVNSRYYLGLCRFLDGDVAGARAVLEPLMDHPDLVRQARLYGAYILGQAAEARGNETAARAWYEQMAEAAPQAIPALQAEARRHKGTPYSETLHEHLRAMERIIAQRPLTKSEDMT